MVAFLFDVLLLLNTHYSQSCFLSDIKEKYTWEKPTRLFLNCWGKSRICKCGRSMTFFKVSTQWQKLWVIVVKQKKVLEDWREFKLMVEVFLFRINSLDLVVSSADATLKSRELFHFHCMYLQDMLVFLHKFGFGWDHTLCKSDTKWWSALFAAFLLRFCKAAHAGAAKTLSDLDKSQSKKTFCLGATWNDKSKNTARKKV